MMLAIHGKAPGQRVMMRAMTRVGDYASAELAFADYAQVAHRLSDELAYAPGSRRKDVYPGTAVLFTEEITQSAVGADTILALRPEVAKAMELLKW
jgi:DNA-binding SARP family transcriptional activator